PQGTAHSPVIARPEPPHCSRLPSSGAREFSDSARTPTLHSRRVALLVLLPRPARARIVPSNLCSRAHRLRSLRLRRPRLILQILLLPLLSALHLARKIRQTCRRFLAHSRGSAGSGPCRSSRRLPWRLSPRLARLRRFALLQLDVKQIADRFVINPSHHVFKQNERFLLELDQRVFLPITAQPDPFFQMVEREQVVFPLRIHHVKNDSSFQPAHQFRAKLFFFLLVALGDCHNCGFHKLIVTERAGIRARRFHIHAKLRVRFRRELRGIPLI